MKKAPYILYDYQIFEMQRYGGISRYFCEILQRISMKHRVSIRYSINYYLQWSLNKYRIPLPRCLFRRYQTFFQMQNHKITIQLLQTKKRIIFHPTYYNPYFLEYIGNIPYVITVHDMIHEKFPNLVLDADIVIKQKKEVITRANRIIAISENTKKDIIDILHISPEKIDVIYHSTNMKPYSGKYKLNLPDTFLLFVGERTPYKNFSRFIKAFALLHKKDANLHTICTGSPLTEKEKKQIEDLGISNNITHIKASDRTLSELYSRARLFVFPSLYEGFGIPILEAYACHCPVALSNTSCFPEIAEKAGCYFDPYSITSIADAIRNVIYNEKKRQQLIIEGDKQIKKYSWQKAAKETELVYKKTIKNE